MKQDLIIALSTISLATFLGGCRHPVEETPNLISLPPQVAGTWQARDNDWMITLDPNGTVTSARIPMGKVSISPNKTTKVEMKDGSWSTYEGGDCIVKYDPVKRELYVQIEVSHLDIRYLDNRLEGNSTDRFIGPVSEDGQKWTADWITQFDYGPRFPQDPNNVFGGTVIFDKVEEEAEDAAEN
jgi:hypothetical protein